MTQLRPSLSDRVIIPAFLVRLYVREPAATVNQWAAVGLFPAATLSFYTLGSLRRWDAEMSAWEFH